MSADSNYVTANFPAPPPYTDIQRGGGVDGSNDYHCEEASMVTPLYQGLRKGQEWTSLVDDM